MARSNLHEAFVTRLFAGREKGSSAERRAAISGFSSIYVPGRLLLLMYATAAALPQSASAHKHKHHRAHAGKDTTQYLRSAAPPVGSK